MRGFFRLVGTTLLSSLLGPAAFAAPTRGAPKFTSRAMDLGSTSSVKWFR
jgi:hypothetical protein